MYEKKYTIGKTEIKETIYEKSNLHATGGNRHIEKGQKGKYHQQNSRQRQSIRKKTVRELILNNFENGKAKFITLTFANEEIGKDINLCEKEFKRFINRLAYQFNSFKYVATVEKQKERETYHYHIVCNLPEIEQTELLKTWGLGTVWIEKAYDLSGLSGYMTKDFKGENIEGYEGKKAYHSSKGLNKSKVVRSWREGEKEACEAVQMELEGIEPSYKYVTKNEEAGKFYHTIYKDKGGIYDKLETENEK